MRIDYDPQADALYISLKDGKVADTLEVTPNIFVDVDELGAPLGIELLFVTRHFAAEDIMSVTFNIGKMFPLAEAA